MGLRAIGVDQFIIGTWLNTASAATISDQLDENAVQSWPAIWQQALQELGAPEVTRAKLDGINSGMQALLESREDQDEALHSVNNGLLSSRPMDLRQFQIAIQRYLKA